MEKAAMLGMRLLARGVGDKQELWSCEILLYRLISPSLNILGSL